MVDQMILLFYQILCHVNLLPSTSWIQGKQIINELVCVKTWTLALAPRPFMRTRTLLCCFIFTIWRRVLDEKKVKKLLFHYFQGTRHSQHDWNLFCILHSYTFFLKFMLIFIQFKCFIHKQIHIMPCYIDRPDVP